MMTIPILFIIQDSLKIAAA